MEDTSLGADLAAAMGDTSTQTPAVETPPTVDTPAPPEAATTAPAGETTAPTTTDTTKQGPIPFQVHHTALENARAKTRAEVEAEWKDIAWARNPRAAEVVQRVLASDGDPLRFFAQQFDELAAHAVYGPQLRSFLGQRFGALRGRSQPAVEEPPTPDVEIRNDQGQVVGHTFSAEAQARREAWLKQQWMQEVTQTFAPRLQTLDTIQQEREVAATRQQADYFGRTFFEELSALPGFSNEKHGKLIAEELQRTPLPENAHPDVVRARAYQAYAKVVVPELQSQAVRSAVATQEQKATVNTASPQTGSTGTPKTYADMTWAEAFQHEMAARR